MSGLPSARPQADPPKSTQTGRSERCHRGIEAACGGESRGNRGRSPSNLSGRSATQTPHGGPTSHTRGRKSNASVTITDDTYTILAANAKRAPHCRPSFPIPPRGWCAPCPSARRRGAQRHHPRRYPAPPGPLTNQARPRRGAESGSLHAQAAACPAPAGHRSPGPVALAALARASARPPSPVPLRQPPRISQSGRRALHPGGMPPTQPRSLFGSKHAAPGMRSQHPGAAVFHARLAHQRSHVARIGHDGSRGNASQPVAAAEHRAQ